MNEILLTILEKFRKPFWRVFLLSWITWNWQIWYLTIFVNSNIFQLNKLDYIINKYSYFENYKENLQIYGINIYDILFPQIGIFIHWFLLPIFFSYLIVWHFPYVTDKFLEQNKENKKREDKILKEEIESETEVIIAQKENIREKEELKEIKEESKYEEWDEDYLKTSKHLGHDFYTMMENIGKSVYDYYGYTIYNGDIIIPSNLVQLADVNGLINLNIENHSLKLSEKGRFFLKNFTMGDKPDL